MSPIPSVPTAFAFSPATPSVTLDPGLARKSATAMSQRLLGTGGLMFAVVAIVSVAGYFYHARAGNNARASNTWASLTSFFSSMRHRGSTATSKATVTDWPVDLEVSPEHHVSMVYARFFHPTFWNLVECHPATSSAPAICVEDEAEIPASESKPFGMNSFLDMDDDDEGDRGRDGNSKGACENESSVQGATPRVGRVPPYDTSAPTDINFSSEVIGTTVRGGAFLSVLDEHEDDPSEASSSDSELDITCSPYDGVLTTPPVSSDDLSKASFDSEFDSACSPYDGILMTPPGSSHDLSVALSDGLDSTCLPYDGIMTAPWRLSPSSRRYGMVDMADLAQTLKDTIPEEGYPLAPTISSRTGLCDVSEFVETNSAMSRSRKLPGRCKPVDDKPMVLSCDIGVRDRHDGLRKGSSDSDVSVLPHEGLDLIRRLLDELRDPHMDCIPRSLSEDSDSEYSEHDEDKGTVPQCTPMRDLDGMRRISLESSSTIPRTNSDVSDEGPIYPLTPPPRSATSYVHMLSAIAIEFNVEVKSPTSSYSPPSLPSKAHIRTRRDSRSFLYGPRSPLMVLPRL